MKEPEIIEKFINVALALQTEEVKKMLHNVDSKLQELINTGKIDLIVPMPLKTIRWLYDPDSKILLISDSLWDQLMVPTKT